MKFFLKRSLKVNTPLCIEQICDEFSVKRMLNVPDGYLRKRFMSTLVPRIEHINNYDVEELAKLYFVASLPVSESFLKRLRQTASVEISFDRKITKFEGRKIRFRGNHRVEDKLKLFEQYKISKAKTTSLETKKNDSVASLFSSTKEAQAEEVITDDDIPDINKMFSYSPTTTVLSIRDLIATSMSCTSRETEHFQKQSARNLVVLSNCSTKKNSPFVSPGEELSSPQISLKTECENSNVEYENAQQQDDFLKCEDLKMLNFLIQKAIRSKSPLVMSHVWGDYVKDLAPNRTHQSVQSRFQTSLAPKIYEMEEFDLDTKALMLFASRTPVDEVFYKSLKKNGSVKLDENHHIIKYKSFEVNGLSLKQYFTGSEPHEKKRVLKNTDQISEKHSYKRRREVVSSRAHPTEPVVFKTCDYDSTNPVSNPNKKQNNISQGELSGPQNASLSVFLEQLKSLVASSNSPMFTDLNQLLRKKLDDLNGSNKKVQLTDVFCVLKLTICYFFQKTSGLEEAKISSSMQEFTKCFDCFLFSFDSQAFNSFRSHIDQLMVSSTSTDKFMMGSTIHQIVEMLINTVTR